MPRGNGIEIVVVGSPVVHGDVGAARAAKADAGPGQLGQIAGGCLHQDGAGSIITGYGIDYAVCGINDGGVQNIGAGLAGLANGQSLWYAGRDRIEGHQQARTIADKDVTGNWIEYWTGQDFTRTGEYRPRCAGQRGSALEHTRDLINPATVVPDVDSVGVVVNPRRGAGDGVGSQRDVHH